MNKSYKSAMDKINIPQEKKLQLEQLFYEQKSPGKKLFLKPAIAIALCVILVITISYTKGLTGHEKINGFEILVNAKTAISGDTEFNNDTICGMGQSSGDGDVGFSVDFPLTCKGVGIKKISYTVSGGYFQVTYPENGKSTVKGKEVKPSFDVSGANSYVANYKEKIYQKISLDYGKQSDGKTCIQIVSNAKILPKEQQKIIKNMSESEIYNTENIELYKIFADNIQVKCAVTLKNGKTKTKNLKLKVKKQLLSEICTDMKVKKDGEVVYAVYCLKQE